MMRRNQSLPANKQSRPTGIINLVKKRQSAFAPVASGSNVPKPVPRDKKSKKSTDYPNAVSPRILQSPNSKEVYCIFEHLVRQVDPSFRVEQRTFKAEELCWNILRTLGYPYALSKQYLATPGAPHAWPLVLSALDWLREESISLGHMFEYDANQDMNEEPMGLIIHRMKLEWFRNGSLDSKRLEHYQSEMNKIMGCPDPADVKRMEVYLAELRAKLTSMNNLTTEEESLKVQIDEGNLKLRNLISQEAELKNSLSIIEANYKKDCTECEALEKEVADIESHLAAVRAKIKELDDAGFGRLAQEYTMLCERYETRLKAKDDLTKEVEEMELAYSRREGIIAPALDAYNRLVGALKLPENSAIGKQCNLKICTYRAGFDITRRIPSLVDDVKSCLDLYRSAQSECQQQIRDVEGQIEHVRASIRKSTLPDLEAKIDDAKTELADLDHMLMAEEDSHAASEKAFLAERVDWAKQLDQLEADLVKTKEAAAEAEKLLDRKVNERLKLGNYIDSLKQQMSVFVPWLQAQIEWKESCDRAVDLHLSALRHEGQVVSDRIEQKVKAALNAASNNIDI